MTAVEGRYYDGKSTQQRKAALYADAPGRLRVAGDGVEFSCALADVRASSRLGNTRRHLTFADGSQFETADNDAIDAIFAGVRAGAFGRLLHHWESTLGYVAAACVLTVVMIWAGVAYGIPALAKQVAFRMPAATDELLGQQALETLDKLLFEPTRLPPQRQAELQKLFADMISSIQGDGNYRLELRAGKAIGANALALPSGIVVMTDALVALAHSDDELTAVLAHEIGHLRQRHALRRVLQDSGTVVVLVAITGDISSVISLTAVLPGLLVQSAYSRDFEREADDFAFDYAKQRGIPPAALTAILTRMEKKPRGAGGVMDYVSSHPATREREERARAAQQK